MRSTLLLHTTTTSLDNHLFKFKMATKIVNDATVSSNLENDDLTIIHIPDDRYPADEDMHIQLQQDEWLQPWRELPLNTWLQITQQKDVKLERGVVKILSLLERDGTSLKAWSTINISRDIEKIQKKRYAETRSRKLPPANLFVKILGKKVSTTKPSRTYFNTKFMYF